MEQDHEHTIKLMDGFIKFYADWCGPCKVSRPTHQKIANETDQLLVEVDIDNDPEGWTQEFKVLSVPTVVRLKDGREVARSIGAKTLSQTKADLGL